MRLCIVGAGYVGLVTGACLAEVGHEVVCVDVDAARVDRIQRGIAPIHEPGLPELLRKHAGGRLSATTDLPAAVARSELTLIAVGTPLAGPAIDLSHVRQVTGAIGRALRDRDPYHVVAVKSTVVPGTTDEVVVPLLEAESGKHAGRDFGVGVNPEFLTEGEAVRDFMAPDRLVFGGLDGRTVETLAAVYAPFRGVDQVRTNNRTAEMIKYASNALLATMISFSNEFANLCRALGGIDVTDVLRGVHLSHYLRPREGANGRAPVPIAAFLWPGCGFGGSCLPKDVQALAAHGRAAGRPMRVLEAVLEVNARQPDEIFSLLAKHFPSLAGARVSVLGLAFRPDTADMRESPALPVVEGLRRRGACVTVYDPAAGEEAARIFAGTEVRLAGDLQSAVASAEAIVLVTRWREFDRVPALVRAMDPPPLVVDGRRMLDREQIARYEGVGT